MRILIVEDDQLIRETLRDGLTMESYAVDVASDGREGYLSARGEDYDLIILDVMMPEMDGLEVCCKLRGDRVETPILFLTARDQASDIVDGLDRGGDDYLPKPFDFDVLLARVRALLRRPKTKLGENLVVGDLTLNPATKEVERAGQAIKLTQKEFALLEYLMRCSPRVCSKENIISHVWDFDADVLPNNVESFIKFLRKKVDKPFCKPLIKTVSGFGYKIDDQE